MLESAFVLARVGGQSGPLIMELEDSLDEMFQWQTPFCCTPGNNVNGSEGTIPGVDAMLVDIDFPETSVGPEQAAPAPHTNPSIISLWPTDPVSISLSPSRSSRTIPVTTSAIQAPASIRNPLAVSSKPCTVQTGTTGLAIPTPTTPISSAPYSPPVVKPKGSRGSGTAKPKYTPKKKKSPQKLGLGTAGRKSKENREPTTAEHIIRERQRRDDMCAKYLILESLLPPAPKRERAVVVEDAISFVGALHQKKVQLLNRRADLKVMAAYNQSPWRKQTGSLAPLCGPFGAGNPSHHDEAAVVAREFISGIHVHVGKEEVLMDMVWNKPRLNFQSALLQAVQSLGLDVTRCSILRVGKDCVQCVVSGSKSQAQLQRISETQSSSTFIIGALRNMLTRS